MVCSLSAFIFLILYVGMSHYVHRNMRLLVYFAEVSWAQAAHCRGRDANFVGDGIL